MNCKPGDLAVIVKSNYGHEGKFVRCLQRHDGPWVLEPVFAPGWIIDIPLLKDGALCPYMLDSFLRPIRDQPGTDEMIRIAGKPNKEKVGG